MSRLVASCLLPATAMPALAEAVAEVTGGQRVSSRQVGRVRHWGLESAPGRGHPRCRNGPVGGCRIILRVGLIIALLVALPARPVTAQNLRDTHFASDGSCYLRHYSAAHLATHPDQRVQDIAIGPETDDPADHALILTLRVRLRGDAGGQGYSATAYCEPVGVGMHCGLEGDAGSFTLAAAQGGALLLKVGGHGMSFEGDAGFLTLQSDRGDDRAFLLPPVPADACP